ncbi:Histone-lysine N-methyltransferase [Aphelenchoides bicaudatus]|nr:Histone-lysine N-methyltransferase [Aphelenchoides bicaudatus]
MSFEAVPCVFKNLDGSGKETQMLGLIIRPSGQSSSTSPNSAKVATTAIPIAPVNGQVGQQQPTQIQILQNSIASNAPPKTTILRPCGTARADPAALLAAARSVNPASILRPISTTTTAASGKQVLKSTTKSPKKLVKPAVPTVQTVRSVVTSALLEKKVITKPTPRIPKSQIAKEVEAVQEVEEPVKEVEELVKEVEEPVKEIEEPIKEVKEVEKSPPPPTIHNFCKDLPVDKPTTPIVEKEVSFEEPKSVECNFATEQTELPTLDVYKPPETSHGDEYQQQQPSTSTANAQMSESAALEDLNSIEMNQLLANTSTINTEDYLDQTLSSNMDFYVDRPSTSANFNFQQQKQTPNCSTASNCSTANHQFQAPPPLQHYNKTPYFYPPNPQSHHSNSHMPHLMPQPAHYQNHNIPHTAPLLQPAHLASDHAPSQHHHFGHRNINMYGNFNHQQVDPRRAALMNGMQGSNQLSTSPDSGIQSIDGSPPSMCTPPMVSPYTLQAANYDMHGETSTSGYQGHPSYGPPSCSAIPPAQSNAHEDDDDFSDMPTLVRADQDVSEQPEQPEYKAPASVPELCSKLDTSNGSAASISLSSRSFSRASTSQLEEDKESAEKSISITAGMDLTEIAERLMSTLDPEKLKQFTSIIQSKALEGAAKDQPESAVKSSEPSNNVAFKTPAKSKRPSDVTAQRRPTNDENVERKRRGRPPGSSKKPPQPVENEASESEDESPSSRHQETEEEIALKNERLRLYRKKVEAKLRLKLEALIVRTEQQLKNTHLNLGPCHPFPLPWRSPNWKLMEKRKRKSDQHDSEEEDKKLKLDSEVVVKKARGRPKHKPPVLKVEVAKKSPGRPRRKQLKQSPEKQKKPQTPELLQVRTDDKSKSPVIKWRRHSKNKNDFVKIRSNVLIDVLVRFPDAEPCSCTVSNACVTRNCSHRANFEECTQATCEWHDQCQNRRMGNNEAIHQLQIFDTEKCGRGVRSATEIHSGQFICEFVGEVVKHQNYQLRTLLRSEDMPRFGIHLTNNFVVDATQKGSIARFINHSCDPNCEMQRWTVNGYYRLGIFAKKQIKEGEELTYDYGMFAHLEPKQRCECGSEKCKDFISFQQVEKPNVCEEPQQFNKSQLALVRKTHILLPRNLKKFNRRLPNRSVPLQKRYPELSSFLLGIYEGTIQHAENKEHITRKRITRLCNSMRRLMSMSHKSPDDLAERFDGIMKSWLNSLYPTYEHRALVNLRACYVNMKKSRDIERHCPRLTKDTIRMFTEERKKQQLAAKREHRVLCAEADLTYINSGCKIGSYSPDELAEFPQKCDDQDCVRCLCGITEDDGNMVSCDKCNFWLHADCVRYDATENEEFVCEYCQKSLTKTFPVDIVLKPQPEFNLPGCTYYRTLVNARGIQVRVNEAVYVERLINDDYKALLKSMHEECAQIPKKRGRKLKDPQKIKEREQNLLGTALTKTEFNRQDVRHFRVERLFVSPQGQRFVFGCYYARPHETFCDSTRLFHKNELFWTPMFDTLPLDAVIGRCLILEPVNWIDGRPRNPKYKEEDVYLCEYQIDKNQRTFTKIPPNNHYYLNTASYVFEKFDQKKELKRDFTPFVMGNSNPKMERNENKEKVMNVAKELSARRLNLVWKQIVTRNQLGLSNFRTQSK